MTSEATLAAGASAPGEQSKTLVDHLLGQVRGRADAPALYTRSGERWIQITWGQFGDGARRIASYLISEDIAPGDHVGIWAGNRAEWHTADAATLLLRAHPVPVYQTLSAEQAQYVLNHSETRLVFVESEAILARVLEQRDQLRHLRRIVVMEGVENPSPDGLVVPWEHALSVGQEQLDRNGQEIDQRAAQTQMDDVVTLIYTSGTTGPPKAVMLTNRNIAASAAGLESIVEVGPDDRVLSYLPLAHIAERMVSEFRSYRYGNPTWFLDGLPNLGARLREVRPTHFFGVPRVWEKMAAQVKKQIAGSSPARRTLARWAIATGRRASDLEERGEPLPASLQRRLNLADKLVLSKLRQALGFDDVRILASGAAPIDPEVLRFFRSIGLEICEVYGQSENTGSTTLNFPGRSRIGTVGEVFPGNEVRIADDGEILVRGDVVFPGYLKDREDTEATLVDGWLQTGDVGEFDADGYLRITDRKKDLIITAGGKNISPGNIENALATHPLIGHVVAIGDRRPYMTALLTLDPEEAPAIAGQRGWPPSDLAALAQHPGLRDELQKHLDAVNAGLSHVEQVKGFAVLPEDFTVDQELTPTMKVKRKVVAEKYADQIEALYSKRDD
ncbi:MAG: long-chain fatty acid--CoA ligase [Candidatus Dormibacteraeota bacterium]|uniref:Acyl-CoA synthetase n=1 Tax=Candidatus Amunia macphersoniae TaxID=3127014 RepID=A0A934NJ41_9BACT|nr:long-chain fatty acid--CoA ligase [Candidatus Dormibacteraeota bacterium]